MTTKSKEQKREQAKEEVKGRFIRFPQMAKLNEIILSNRKHPSLDWAIWCRKAKALIFDHLSGAEDFVRGGKSVSDITEADLPGMREREAELSQKGAEIILPELNEKILPESLCFEHMMALQEILGDKYHV